jgi:hypothetical protein
MNSKLKALPLGYSFTGLSARFLHGFTHTNQHNPNQMLSRTHVKNSRNYLEKLQFAIIFLKFVPTSSKTKYMAMGDIYKREFGIAPSKYR